MILAERHELVKPTDAGEEMHAFAAELYPLCRSITGTGLRETLARIGRHVPLELHEVPSGTTALDWTVPQEWTVRDAWIKDESGRKVVDFKEHNLHLVSYSVPVRGRFTLDELKPHLFSLPDRPDWIPYRTSYYKPAWGFCLTHRQLAALPAGSYEVCVDTSLTPGELSYGEVVLPGSSPHEVLISTHCCHPSLANDNLSGIAIATWLARHLRDVEHHYTYRFLFLPVTIGAITWLSRNQAILPRVKHGLVLSCAGDAGPFTYKRSRRGDAEIDAAAEYVLRTSGTPHAIQDFSPYGYDERQFCSPGFNLPMGCFMRTPNGCYPEYHTSADNLDLIQPTALGESLAALLRIVEIIEQNRRYRNLSPKGEPQLGRRGLYTSANHEGLALLWVLNFSDGEHSLLDIGQRSNLPFVEIARAAHRLNEAGLLAPAD